MKKYFIQKSLIVVLGFTIMFNLSSCYKKFDPDSYKPAFEINGYTSSGEIAKSSLIAYFSFNESLIDSVSGTSCTNYGTTFTPALVGSGLKVGLNNYVTFPATSAIKSMESGTISFWVNTSMNSAGIQTPVCFVNSTDFWGRLDMFFDGQSSTSSVFKMHVSGTGGDAWLTGWSLANPWSTWQNITLTYDASSTTFTFYVNGTKVGSSVQSAFGKFNFASVPTIVFGTMQFQTSPSLTSSASAQSWCSYVLGTIDEVRIYNKALSATEIASLLVLQGKGK